MRRRRPTRRLFHKSAAARLQSVGPQPGPPSPPPTSKPQVCAARNQALFRCALPCPFFGPTPNHPLAPPRAPCVPVPVHAHTIVDAGASRAFAAEHHTAPISCITADDSQHLATAAPDPFAASGQAPPPRCCFSSELASPAKWSSSTRLIVTHAFSSPVTHHSALVSPAPSPPLSSEQSAIPAIRLSAMGLDAASLQRVTFGNGSVYAKRVCVGRP